MNLNTKIALAAIAGVGTLVTLGILALSDRQSSEEGWPTPATLMAAEGAGEGGQAGAEKPGFTAVAPPRPLPVLDLTDETGQPAGLDAYRGKVVLVNFWATWCVPCVEELPALSRLQARLSGPDFTVIAVSGDRTGPEAVAPFLAQHGITGLPVLYDRTLASGRALHVMGLPTSILLDRDGREVGRVLGTLEWDSREAVRPIEDAIKGRMPESG